MGEDKDGGGGDSDKSKFDDSDKIPNHHNEMIQTKSRNHVVLARTEYQNILVGQNTDK